MKLRQAFALLLAFSIAMPPSGAANDFRGPRPSLCASFDQQALSARAGLYRGALTAAPHVLAFLVAGLTALCVPSSASPGPVFLASLGGGGHVADALLGAPSPPVRLARLPGWTAFKTRIASFVLLLTLITGAYGQMKPIVHAPEGDQAVWVVGYDSGADIAKYRADHDEVDLGFYAFNDQGRIVPEDAADALATRARAAVRPGGRLFATVINNQSGRAAPELIRDIVENESRMRAHIRDLLALAKNFDGIELDYEALKKLPPDGKFTEAYTRFIQVLRDELHTQGKWLSITVEPDPKNLDWGALGRLVDQFKVMAYWSHGYGTGPGALVTPQLLEQIVNHAKESGVPAEKLVIGLPTYGFLWTRTAGGSWKADQLEHKDPAELAKEWGIDLSKAPRDGDGHPHMSHRESNGTETECWYADTTSIARQKRFVLTLGRRLGYPVKNFALWRAGRGGVNEHEVRQPEAGTRGRAGLRRPAEKVLASLQLAQLPTPSEGTIEPKELGGLPDEQESVEDSMSRHRDTRHAQWLFERVPPELAELAALSLVEHVWDAPTAEFNTEAARWIEPNLKLKDLNKVFGMSSALVELYKSAVSRTLEAEAHGGRPPDARALRQRLATVEKLIEASLRRLPAGRRQALSREFIQARQRLHPPKPILRWITYGLLGTLALLGLSGVLRWFLDRRDPPNGSSSARSSSLRSRLVRWFGRPGAFRSHARPVLSAA